MRAELVTFEGGRETLVVVEHARWFFREATGVCEANAELVLFTGALRDEVEGADRDEDSVCIDCSTFEPEVGNVGKLVALAIASR